MREIGYDEDEEESSIIATFSVDDIKIFQKKGPLLKAWQGIFHKDYGDFTVYCSKHGFKWSDCEMIKYFVEEGWQY